MQSSAIIAPRECATSWRCAEIRSAVLVNAMRLTPAAIAMALHLVAGIKRIADIESRCRPIPRSTPTARPLKPTSTCSRPRSMRAQRVRLHSSFLRTIAISLISIGCAPAGSPRCPSCRILPVQNFKQTKAFAALLRRFRPDWLAQRFEGLHDVATRKLIAAAVAAEQVLDLVDAGSPTLTFKMNRADLVYAICHLLGLRPTVAVRRRTAANSGALPLPLGERVGVRGAG